MNSLDECWYVCIVWASEGPTGDLSRPRRSTFVAEWKFFVVVEQVVLEWDSILLVGVVLTYGLSKSLKLLL